MRDKIPFVIPEKLDASQAPLALRVLFVFTCAALWVGLSSSLQEIVKEAAIYLRERLVNLGLFAYLGSKLTILSALAFLQTLLITVVILIFFKSPDLKLIPWQLGLGITTFLTLLTTISLGLMVSAAVKNSNQANSVLPLLLIPQIIFSGVLFKMEGIASKISWLMLSRWSIGAYGALVNVNAMVPEALKLPDGSIVTRPFERRWSIGAYGALVNVNAMVPEALKLPDGTIVTRPFEPTPIYDATMQNLTLNWGILCLHTAIYLSVAFWLQKRKDIFS